MSQEPPKQEPPVQEPDELLEDLEDLHGFLEEENIPELTDPETTRPDDLSEPIQDALPLLEEEIASDASDSDAAEPANRISDETIQTLLGDAWQDSADQLLADARQTISSHSTLWQPEDTDELNHALKVRIDDTVRHWLGDVLKAHIHLLHQQIVSNLAAELTLQINHKLNQDADPADASGNADPQT